MLKRDGAVWLRSKVEFSLGFVVVLALILSGLGLGWCRHDVNTVVCRVEVASQRLPWLPFGVLTGQTAAVCPFRNASHVDSLCADIHWNLARNDGSLAVQSDPNTYCRCFH